MQYVSGHILTDAGFLEGYLGFEGGVIREMQEGAPPSCTAEGVVIPTLINAHTHVADFKVPLDLSLPLERIVAPPDGVKHTTLENMTSQELKAAMRKMSSYMFTRGASRFIDFREGGVEGSRLLGEVQEEGRGLVLGRPRHQRFEEQEMERLLEYADGVGISSITDWEPDELRLVADFVNGKGKYFAIHASERIREDIEFIIDLQPDFLVHMVKASDSDMERCAQEGIPVVICPRSNMFFGSMPPIARMIDKGLTLALGTDNAMISLPDMLIEMEQAARILRYQGREEISEVFDMTTENGRKILNEKVPIGIKPGRPCDFMVLEGKNGNVMTDIILRSGAKDPVLVCVGESTWRRSK